MTLFFHPGHQFLHAGYGPLVGDLFNQFWIAFALWSIPMIVAPPMFSRDVFSYAAQGEMTSPLRFFPNLIQTQSLVLSI